LGVQERRLGQTRLFVLPSTSPANAAVSWDERLRWFQELAGRATGRPLRPAVRAVVVDDADRVLLTRYDFPEEIVWAPPGGGIEVGETDEQALRRELFEEAGLAEFELGPLIWKRDHRFAYMQGWGGQTERIYLVRVDAFEPEPQVDLAAEYVAEIRWWGPEELAASAENFAPRAFPSLVADLLADGPPAEPIDPGV
jgi:ADP-ribose pyrophosphatase YjhB (NUDIX family)